MRAGANEFFPWNPAAPARRRGPWRNRSTARSAGRRRGVRPRRRRPPALRDARVPRRQGRRGHDDRRGELRGRARAADQAADRASRSQAALGEVALFLGVRPRFTVLDAIENLHRLDRDFLQGADGASTSPASTSSPVPSSSTARTPQDAAAIEELLRVLGTHLRLHRHRRRQHDQRLRRRRRSMRPTSMFLVDEPRRPVDPQRAAARRPRPAARRRQRARQGPAQPRLRPEPDRAEADRDRARLRDSPHVRERLPHGLDALELRRAAGADQQLGTRRAVRRASRDNSSACTTRWRPSRRSAARSSASSDRGHHS